MEPLVTEIVKRKATSTFKLLLLIGLTAVAVQVGVNALSKLPQGWNMAASLLVIALGVSFVWKLISHHGESFTYKITDGLLVIERRVGRSATSFFSLNLKDIREIRGYAAALDRAVHGKRRFTVSRDPASWWVVVFETPEEDRIIFEPSERFAERLAAHIAREKVNP